MTHSGFVLGVDGCRQGWVGVVIPVEGAAGDPARGVFGTTLAALAAGAGPVDGVGVDMPLHLTDDPWPRPADVAARAHLGSRGATLFVTPPASAYEAADYAAGCDIARERTGSAFSRQAWALRAKVRELEAWWRGAGARVWEVHPEVSFSLLAGGVIRPPKSTWAGLEARRAVLAGAGIVVPADLGEAGRRAGPDDVLDAAAVAWTTRRLVAGTARSFPSPPVVLAGGHRQAIWA
ncbi:MAG TPA: DUF429 domain-containing protein [Acidimicrobiales bacterium]|nr:DUF429 domain-containing protein [Acidimicrobiales bacterium]